MESNYRIHHNVTNDDRLYLLLGEDQWVKPEHKPYSEEFIRQRAGKGKFAVKLQYNQYKREYEKATDDQRLTDFPILWWAAFAKHSKRKSNTNYSDVLTLNVMMQEKITDPIAILDNAARGFLPSLKVDIPKPNGKIRTLGVPNPKKKMLEEVINLIIEPRIEKKLSSDVYGYRRGLGAQDAIKKLKTFKNKYVIEGDIEKYFDSIPHDKLLKRLEEITNGKILKMISALIKLGYYQGNEIVDTRNKGVPQGGILSPLLSNLYLTPLDDFINKRKKTMNIEYIRYADDWIVITDTMENALWLKNEIAYELEKLGLKLNAEKTRITNLHKERAKFLGIFFGNKKKRLRTHKRFYPRYMRILVKTKPIKSKINEALKLKWSKITEIESREILKRRIKDSLSIIKGSLNYVKPWIEKSRLKMLARTMTKEVQKLVIARAWGAKTKPPDNYLERVNEDLKIKWSFNDKRKSIKKVKEFDDQRLYKLAESTKMDWTCMTCNDTEECVAWVYVGDLKTTMSPEIDEISINKGRNSLIMCETCVVKHYPSALFPVDLDVKIMKEFHGIKRKFPDGLEGKVQRYNLLTSMKRQRVKQWILK